MASNETVAEIAKRVRRECNSYPLPANAAEMLKLAREFQAAHKREMDHRALIAGVSLADAVDDAHKRKLAAKDAEIAELEGRFRALDTAIPRVVSSGDHTRILAIVNRTLKSQKRR